MSMMLDLEVIETKAASDLLGDCVYFLVLHAPL